jgi:hypothetical protein
VPILGGDLCHANHSAVSLISIAPIMNKDGLIASQDEEVRYFRQPSGSDVYSGIYVKSNRTIYLSVEWPTSEFWKGLLLLHEGFHALDHISGRSASMPLWQQEVRARRFESSVVAGLYGGRVDRIADKMAPSIAAASKSVPLRQYLAPPGVDTDLASLFGVSISRYDRAEQRDAVRRLAICRYLRRTHAGPELWRESVPLP